MQVKEGQGHLKKHMTLSVSPIFVYVGIGGLDEQFI